MSAWLFWLFLFSAVVVVVYRGGYAEKWFSGAIILSVTATFVINNTLGWVDAHLYILVLDGALLALSLGFVSKSQRYWPIWFAAFQAIAVATSFAFMIFPNQVPQLYINSQGFWFLPALISMVVGVILDTNPSYYA